MGVLGGSLLLLVHEQHEPCRLDATAGNFRSMDAQLACRPYDNAQKAHLDLDAQRTRIELDAQKSRPDYNAQRAQLRRESSARYTESREGFAVNDLISLSE